jgi:uncharacterized protein YneR
MKIEVSKEALKWFQEELEVKKGDKVKFYAQIYGSSPVQQSYSLGFSKDDPIDIAASIESEGVLFFVEESDLWYFDGHDLQVGYNEKVDELEFTYKKP